MAGAAFEVTFDDAAFLAGLDRVQAGLADPTPLLRILGAYGTDSTVRRFATQAGPDGTAWHALLPAYADIKAAMGGSPDILRFSGDLMNSQHYETGADLVRWGSGLPYARAQQFGAVIVPKEARALSFVLGGRFARGNSGAMGMTQAYLVHVQSVTLPARPYLGLSLDDRAEIVGLTKDYIRRLI
jgi:phage gpG-like protein